MSICRFSIGVIYLMAIYGSNKTTHSKITKQNVKHLMSFIFDNFAN